MIGVRLVETQHSTPQTGKNYDIAMLIRNDGPLSPLQPGSEFCPIELLDPLFDWHPFWPAAKKTILEGARFYQEPLHEDLRLGDLREALRYGNHKSAIKKADFLQEALLLSGSFF